MNKWLERLISLSPWARMAQAMMPQPLLLKPINCEQCGALTGWQRADGTISVLQCRTCLGDLRSVDQLCDTDTVR